MARRITPSQLKSRMRQAQQKQRQAVDRINREVRAHNQKVKRAVDNYNRDVRAHNARVRANRQRLRNELSRLSRQTVTTRYVTFRTSVNVVQQAYERLEHAAESGRYDERYNDILDLSEREAANNAGLMNALVEDAPTSDSAPSRPEESPLTPLLSAVSSELADRWEGALFALNPQNPDAARHFCTSSREIVSRVLDVRAPDSAVVAVMPDCDRNQRGTPTRRAKVRYILLERGLGQDELEAFVEADMDNVIALFDTFNEGTHGPAGRFGFSQLQAIRKRVEDSIMFLSRLAE